MNKSIFFFKWVNWNKHIITSTVYYLSKGIGTPAFTYI